MNVRTCTLSLYCFLLLKTNNTVLQQQSQTVPVPISPCSTFSIHMSIYASGFLKHVSFWGIKSKPAALPFHPLTRLYSYTASACEHTYSSPLPCPLLEKRVPFLSNNPKFNPKKVCLQKLQTTSFPLLINSSSV